MKSYFFSRLLIGTLLPLAVFAVTIFYTACAPNENQVVVEKSTPESSVDRYMKMIDDSKATGNSVFFQTGEDNWVENPSKQWINEFVNNQVIAAADRSSCDAYSYELFVISGSFYKYTVKIGGSSNLGGGGICFTEGNTYVGSSTVTNCETCPIIKAGFWISSVNSCDTPGKTRVIVHRTTSEGGTCVDFNKVVSTPLEPAQNIGTFCCTFPTCCDLDE